jgi:hypothetical protein
MDFQITRRRAEEQITVPGAAHYDFQGAGFDFSSLTLGGASKPEGVFRRLGLPKWALAQPLKKALLQKKEAKT